MRLTAHPAAPCLCAALRPQQTASAHTWGSPSAILFRPATRQRCSAAGAASAAADSSAKPRPAPSLLDLPPILDLPPVPSDLLLADVRVVIVAPKHEANVGAVARSCANFECLDLMVVAPRCDPYGEEARKVAVGDAVLTRMRVVETLAQALDDTAGSVGFTRRAGSTRTTAASIGHLLSEFPWAITSSAPAPIDGNSHAAPAAAVRPVPGSAGHQQRTEQPDTAGRSGLSNGDGAPGSIASPGGRASGGAAANTRSAATGDGSGGSSSSSSVVAGHGQDEGECSTAAPPQRAITALVFGREESGLTEQELRLCSHACAIPSGRIQPSLNLSHAVAVALAETYSRRCGLLDVASAPLAVAAADSAVAQAAVPAPTPPSNAAAERDVCLVAPQAHSQQQGSPAVAPQRPPAGLQRLQQQQAMAGLQPAAAHEVDLLVRKVAAIAQAAGVSGAEGSGGGSDGNHGRKRLPVGHVRAVASRARITVSESRGLHGLASAVLTALDPDHPLEARKRSRQKAHRPHGAAAPGAAAGGVNGATAGATAVGGAEGARGAARAEPGSS